MSAPVFGTKVAVCIILSAMWYSVTVPQYKLQTAEGDRHEDLVAPVGSLSWILRVSLDAVVMNALPPPPPSSSQLALLRWCSGPH